MGYRTTIIINNDHIDLLDSDKQIADKIRKAILGYNMADHYGNFGNLGHVVEQAHADITKLVIIGKNGRFDVTELASIATTHNVPDDGSTELVLLAKAADALGLRLVQK